MEPVQRIYTVGTWIVHPGKENEFIREWTRFAQWTGKNIPGSSKGYLLQDDKNPLRFISFGSWSDTEAIQTWRESKEFKNFVGTIQELCSDFQPNTLREVSTSE
jgi:heme-degrading monooxygenase HmoA